MKLGCIVYAADRNLEVLQAAWKDFDPNSLPHSTSRVEFLAIDVTKQDEVDAAVQIVDKNGTGLFGIVNGAGVGIAPGYTLGLIQSVVELEVDKWVAPVMNVNLFGTMRVNQAFFKHIFASKGVFLNIASIMGHTATAGMGAYAISKKAVVGYSDTLRRELAPYGVRVGCLAPGFIATPMVLPIFHPEAMKQPRDYSETLLQDGRGDEGQWPMISGMYDELPKPDIVSEATIYQLFHDPIPAHQFIDKPLVKVFHHFMSCLPHRWSDAVLDKLRHRNINSYKVYGPKS